LPNNPKDTPRPRTVAGYDSPAQEAQDLLDGFAELAATIAGCPIAWVSTMQGGREVPEAVFGAIGRPISAEDSAASRVIECETGMCLSKSTLEMPVETGEPIVFFAATPLLSPTGKSIGVLAAGNTVGHTWGASQQDSFDKLAASISRVLRLVRERTVFRQAMEASQSAVRKTQAVVAAPQPEPATPTFVTPDPIQTPQGQEIAELESIARTDGLTGLSNYRAFHDEASRRLASAIPTTMLLIDIDWFKHFNDVHGHVAGDETLKDVARLIGETVEGSGMSARYGGEEFAALLDISDLKQALNLAERLRLRVESYAWKTRPITVCIGVAALGSSIKTVEELVNRADAALYSAKRINGKNKVLGWNG
jgi:diguanylate cyclase (GGDEF)-like protein